MDTYQGRCKFCGTEQPIMAESQDIADEMISGSCSCSGASAEKRKTILMNRIGYIASGSYSDTFMPLPEAEVKMLRQGGYDVMLGNCTAVTFELADSKVKIWDAGDKIKVKRTANREETAEA